MDISVELIHARGCFLIDCFKEAALCEWMEEDDRKDANREWIYIHDRTRKHAPD